MTYHQRDNSSARGVVALLTVIIVGALLLALGITTSFVGQTDLIIAAQSDRAHEVRALASSCIEEAVHRLKLDSGYTGGSVPIGAESCMVSVSGSGSTRTLTASATVAGHTKAVTAGLTLKQNVALNAKAWSITSWTEDNPP